MSAGPPAALGRAPAAPPAWSGLLPVDKPAGVTSHDVVDRARRRLRIAAIGHLGTLDPGARGLLVLAVGAATRCAGIWQGGRKTYAGTARFGLVTDSQDLQGRVLERRPVDVDEAAIRAASRAFVGDLAQVPPMVSALKRGGRRLHQLARRGESVEREPRPVRVDAWTWLGFELPDARFELVCSGGTYVRTLVHDLGQRLGCGAALAALERRRSEPFDLGQAAAWRELDEPADALLARRGIPLDRALEALPAVRLDDAGAALVGRGAAAPLAGPPPAGAPLGAGPRSVVLRDAAGRALALGELRAADTGLEARPHVVFPWAVREGRAG